MRSSLWAILLFFFVVSSAWAAPETLIQGIDAREFCGPTSAIGHSTARACHHDPSKICDCDQHSCLTAALSDCGCSLKAPDETAQLTSELQGAAVLYWWRAEIPLACPNSEESFCTSSSQRGLTRSSRPHAPPPRSSR